MYVEEVITVRLKYTEAPAKRDGLPSFPFFFLLCLFRSYFEAASENRCCVQFCVPSCLWFSEDEEATSEATSRQQLLLQPTPEVSHCISET